MVQVSDPGRALPVLTAHPAVRSVSQDGRQIRVTLGPLPGDQARSPATDINRRLVEAGVDVYRLDLPAATPEERWCAKAAFWRRWTS